MPEAPPARIVVYASDHGFGHAARMLALASRLAEDVAPVTLCAGAAAPMIRAALPFLPAPVDVAFASLDPGLAPRPGALDFDLDRSREALAAWRADLPRLVAIEAERLVSLGAALVVADVPAAAILAAERARIPAVVCSNFTWLDMYAGRFGAELDAILGDAYARARLGYRLRLGAMPLAGLSAIHDIDGVLARHPRRDRAAVRRELGVSDGDLLLGLGLGGSLDVVLYDVLSAAAPASGVRLLAPSHAADPPRRGPLVHFPAITPDPQSYFGACDLVLAKAGYSTLAEAAIAGVPLAVFPLHESPESVRLALDVEAIGLGVRLADEAEARAALSRPEALFDAARRACRGPLPDAAPALAAALRGLLP
ncbi:glycosyltransferase [Polyangium sp. 6x1]|uniref:glycosyltransferase n=1 Tax=Polyangium sp. 6x1 TaxID=3042689 RepID=UPI0024828FD2|nr:glycosyltransferase [Polyangium sp. 6x1]MDI1450006.1 glycosyltransferase [Polyangium sp. 6x1]